MKESINEATLNPRVSEDTIERLDEHVALLEIRVENKLIVEKRDRFAGRVGSRAVCLLSPAGAKLW